MEKKSRKSQRSTVGSDEEHQTGASGAGETNKDPAGIFSDFAKSTSRVVQQAASILEEEIAAGILTAKQIDDQFISKGETRKRNPDDLMERFRKDSHQVVDILINLLTTAKDYTDKLADQLVTLSGEEKTAGRKMAKKEIPDLMIPQPIEAGGSGELSMTLENDSQKLTDEFTFYNTDLLSESGNRIPARQIKFIPPKIVIEPSSKVNVTIAVNVPKGTPAGVYSGLVQATKMGQLRAILMLTVQ